MTRPSAWKPCSCPLQCVSLCLLALTATFRAAAQTPLPPPAPSPPGVSAPQPIPVTVTVRDKKGRILTDFAREDFRILVDKRQQEIVSFQKPGESRPVVGLLLGASGDWAEQRSAQLEAAILELVRAVVRQKGLMFVAAFGEAGMEETELTSTVGVLEQAVRRWRSMLPLRRMALFDAIHWACTHRVAAYEGRRSLIVISTVRDYFPRLPRAEVRRVVALTHTSVYYLGLWPPFTPATGTAEVIYNLEEFAYLSKLAGGGARVLRNSSEYEESFLRIAEDLGGQYLLLFVPDAPPDSRRPRKLKVEVTRKDARVSSRKAY